MEENRAPLAGPGYEPDQIDGRGIQKFTVGLVVICLVVMVGLAGLYKVFLAREDARQPTADTLGANARGVPPGPRLEVTPAEDLKRIRESEDQILGSYSWVDRENGIIRLPIARAMELVVERGLPTRKAGPVEAGAAVPTDSGATSGGAR